MKKNKSYLIIYCLIYLSVLTMTIGLGISYYNNHIKDHSDIISYKKLNLLVKYDKTDNISLTNLRYNYNDTYTFSIENFSEDTIGKYKLVFEVITPSSNIINENFVYTLNSESLSNDKTNEIINRNETPIPIVSKDLGTGIITPGNTHKYTLNLKLKNSKTNYLVEKVFVAKISVVSIEV